MSGRALDVNQNTAPATDEQVRRRAYELYMEQGCPEGKALEHWLEAEAELNRGQKEGLPETA